jgi:4-amino-4-deoxy-L-arabinose transferase-like glycosyltransferase
MGHYLVSKRGNKPFLLIGGLIVLLAAAFRFVNLGIWPGIEWDENVYRVIGENFAQARDLTAKTEYIATTEPYLYHPPFHFLVLGDWFDLFGSSLLSARVLAVIGSLITLVLLGYFLRRQIGNWALLAIGLIACDAWMIFSNRVSWIENIMIPIGIVGLMLYWWGKEKDSSTLFILAGAVLGLTVAYKHVGLIFPLAVGICWLLIRRQHANHIKLFVAFVATLGMYVGGMALVFGQVYLFQSGVQFARSAGARESRGALTNLGDYLAPLMDQYAIFTTTLVLVGVTVLILVIRTLQMMRRRSLDPVRQYVLLYSWVVATFVFFGALQLRLPHYFMLVLVPCFCYLAAEVGQFYNRATRRDRASKTARVALVLVGLIVLASNGNAFGQRFVMQEHDDALAATAAWTSANLPLDAKVITEESVGSTIVQPYCKMWRGANCLDAKYIITYTTHTQQVPNNEGLQRLIASATQIHEITGFKEDITIYRLPKPVGK